MKKYEFRDKNYSFLIEEDTVGFYLIVYKASDLDRSSEDYLVDTLDEAFLEAKERFGVNRENWKEKKNNNSNLS